MTTEQTLSIIAIAIVLSGLITPFLIKGIVKLQKRWRFKLIKDNGRFDLIDEFDYWYKRLAKERESLESVADNSDFKKIGLDVLSVLSGRLDLLNKFFASRITGDNKLDDEAASQIMELIDNRQEFMDSTRLAFKASKPELIGYFESKGLTEREINYCCLFLIGLRAKEIGNYLGLRNHYNISSSIRTKLGLETNSTNLGIYLRKLMNGDISYADTSTTPADEYTARQVRMVILAEILFGYMGWIIVACTFIVDNLALEIGVIATGVLIFVLGIIVLAMFRKDIMPAVKLAYGMSQFNILSLMGTIPFALLFATSLIPLACYPYIGYPAFIISQFFPLYGLYRYMR